MIGIRALLVRNLTIQTVSEAVSLACGLATSALLSRHLGVAGFGAFNYAFAFTYFFLTLNDLGLSTVAVRDMSREPGRAGTVLGHLLSLRLTLAAIVLAAAWLAAWTWPMDPAVRRPIAILSLILPVTALNTPALLFQTSMRFHFAAASMLTTRVLGLVFVFALTLLDRGVSAMLAGLLIAEVAGLIVIWILARRLIRIPFVWDTAAWRPMIRGAAPLAAGLILAAILNRVDFIMLERMVSMEAVGLYGAAYRVTNMLEKFPIFVMATLFPIMSRLAVDDRARLRDVYVRALWRFAAIGLVLGTAIVIAAPWLLAAIFGEPFRAAAGPLRWLVAATACLYLAMTGGNLLIAMEHATDNVAAIAVGAVSNIALNFILIPLRGIEGAAMATAASFALVLLVTLVAVERRFSAGARA